MIERAVFSSWMSLRGGGACLQSQEALRLQRPQEATEQAQDLVDAHQLFLGASWWIPGGKSHSPTSLSIPQRHSRGPSCPGCHDYALYLSKMN